MVDNDVKGTIAQWFTLVSTVPDQAAAATQDPRVATAARNVEAILDAAERLLQSRQEASISAVASEAGVSRVTVYSHFGDRRQLIEALAQRAVHRATAALQSAEPERGPAMQALQRIIAAGWEEIGRHEAIADAAAAELSAHAMRRSHAAARKVIGQLVERGRAEGAFRTDVSGGWLVTSALALMHAAAEGVRAGELESRAALDVLTVTIGDLFVGREIHA